MSDETHAETARALSGDREAFESLIRRYGRLVYAKAYSMLHHREEAEDIVQETFLKAWASRDSLKEPEKFPQWVVSIARNAALDLRRKRAPLPMPDEGGDVPDPGLPDPSRALEAEEVRRRIFAALSELPEHYRLAVTLRYMEGMDYEGIKKAMGITNGAVRGILARTLQTLRRTLKPWVRSDGRPSGVLPMEHRGDRP